MTEQQIKSLSSEALKAIVNSTNSAGHLWTQKVWARNELDRRRKLGRIEFKSAGAKRER